MDTLRFENVGALLGQPQQRPRLLPELAREQLCGTSPGPGISISQPLPTNTDSSCPMDTQCPCGSTGPKSSFFITCTNCPRVWHPDCGNLSGITQGAAKKLTKWKCPKCFNPYSESESSSFKEFLKVTKDIGQIYREPKG